MELYVLMISEDHGSHYEDGFVGVFSTLEKAQEGAFSYQDYMENRYRTDGKKPVFSKNGWEYEDGNWYLALLSTKTSVDGYSIRKVDLDVDCRG
jgi:hypothetical protein